MQRVLAAAARMEYVASPHAASLAGGQTRAIGVVVPNVTRWFFGSVVHGAEELLRQEGYDLLLYNITGDPAARSRLFSAHLLSKRVDAVMVLALQPTPAEVASLDRIGAADGGGRRRGARVVGRADRRRRGRRQGRPSTCSTSGTSGSPTSAASPTPSTRA